MIEQLRGGGGGGVGVGRGEVGYTFPTLKSPVISLNYVGHVKVFRSIHCVHTTESNTKGIARQKHG